MQLSTGYKELSVLLKAIYNPGFLRLKPIFIAPIQASIEATSESPLLSSSFCWTEINFLFFLRIALLSGLVLAVAVSLKLVQSHQLSCDRTVFMKCIEGTSAGRCATLRTRLMVAMLEKWKA